MKYKEKVALINAAIVIVNSSVNTEKSNKLYVAAKKFLLKNLSK